MLQKEAINMNKLVLYIVTSSTITDDPGFDYCSSRFLYPGKFSELFFPVSLMILVINLHVDIKFCQLFLFFMVIYYKPFKFYTGNNLQQQCF